MRLFFDVCKKFILFDKFQLFRENADKIKNWQKGSGAQIY